MMLMKFGVDIIHMAPMVVFLALAYSAVAAPWMIPVLASLAMFMVVLPIVLCLYYIVMIISEYFQHGYLFSNTQSNIINKIWQDQTKIRVALQTIAITLTLIKFVISLPFGVAAAVLFLKYGATHTAYAMAIALIGGMMFCSLLLSLCKLRYKQCIHPHSKFF
jgi:hypothetical protein